MIPFTDEELRPAVERSLEKVKPMLELDGGGMKLLDIKSGKVFVQLQGACVGCSSSNQTLKYGIERQLRMDIHPEIEVINIAAGMEHMIEQIANQGQ
ncbi:MAG: NifU family protein [Epsilonproteobacteria bacterium]|nr:NifU family protein [Campylobacterota bacterium]